ncbi:hypothetical protein CAPTEDRAFT_213876 [Capitella teleta]|uniref:Uncharacterized protein n=1 Tax=Capitella teleta TaxID=283909 RepID=R7U1R3_CAPTE|nr:hypothetical protein CAPTEDRAFT_213876 [Capitella teleta]|eukprot:ELT97125.1 hypothetical protein CAPTEDRAFT_213876 [Capitella teleta]
MAPHLRNTHIVCVHVSSDCPTDHQMAEIIRRQRNAKKPNRTEQKSHLHVLKQNTGVKCTNNTDGVVTWRGTETIRMESVEEACRKSRNKTTDRRRVSAIQWKGCLQFQWKGYSEGEGRRRRNEACEERLQEIKRIAGIQQRYIYRLVKELANQEKMGSGLCVQNKVGQTLLATYTEWIQCIDQLRS